MATVKEEQEHAMAAALLSVTPAQAALAERLFDHLCVREDGCWQFHGWMDRRNNHCRVVIGSQPRRFGSAARLMYRLVVGEPGGKHVHHVCLNPRCMNPAHLSLDPVFEKGENL